MSEFYVARTLPQLNAKQLDFRLEDWVAVNNQALAAPASSYNASAALTAVATTAGRNGTSVSHQPSATIDTAGWVVSPSRDNKVLINDTATKLPVTDAGPEVFGRLTEAAGVYTISFRKLSSGSEVAATLPAANYDYLCPYNFDFVQLNTWSVRGPQRRQVGQDPSLGTEQVHEILDIVTLNVIPALANTPAAGTEVSLFVNGLGYSTVNPGITLAGNTLTWDEVAMKFDVEPGDLVRAVYLL